MSTFARKTLVTKTVFYGGEGLESKKRPA